MTTTATMPNRGLIDPVLKEAARRGYERSVLDRMQENIVTHFLHRCDENSINHESLSPADVRGMMRSIFSGMVHPEANGKQVPSSDGFRKLYEDTRRSMAAFGVSRADQDLAEAITSMRELELARRRDNSLDKATVAAVSNAFVEVARRTASAYRVVGYDPKLVVDRIDADGVVASLPVRNRAAEAIGDDADLAVVMNRRNEARSSTPAPRAGR